MKETLIQSKKKKGKEDRREEKKTGEGRRGRLGEGGGEA